MARLNVLNQSNKYMDINNRKYNVIFSRLNQFDNWYFLGFKEQRLAVYSFWKHKGKLFRFFIHFLSYLNFKRIDWFWGKWKRTKFEGDAIILFDGCSNIKALETINRNNPSMRKILYLWNRYVGPVSKTVECARNNGWEVWSFDKEDCKEFGFHYNHQFYPFEILSNGNNYDNKYDLLFIGYNKGRRDRLLKLNQEWLDEGLQSKIIIREWSKYGLFHLSYHFGGAKITYRETPYSKVIKLIKKSKCLVDIVKDNQAGLTVRTIEAIAFNKKLVTNNSFVKTMDFYHPNNVYIIGEERNIVDFINEPYVHIDNIEKNYCIINWIKTFNKD